MRAQVFTAIAVGAAVVFAGLYLNEHNRKVQVIEKTVPVDRIVEKRVVVPVERVVEKRVEVPVDRIVEKKVEVPAPIPKEYVEAYGNMKKLSAATSTNLLEGIRDADVFVFVTDAAGEAISADVIKTKLELALRRNGIRVRDKSDQTFFFSVEALPRKLGDVMTYTYTINAYVSEYGVGMNDNVVKQAPVVLWKKGSYGYAPASALKEVVMGKIDEYTDDFCNQWLKDNPKSDPGS